MSENLTLDHIDKAIIDILQQGIPITATSYRDMAAKIGVEEDCLIDRIAHFKDTGLLKRIDFRLNFDEMAIVSTLVGCRISAVKLAQATRIIEACENVTHNYLRKHRLNMWFTLSAASDEELSGILADLRRTLGAAEMISFPTKNRLKLGFHLDVE